MIIADVKLSCD